MYLLCCAGVSHVRQCHDSFIPLNASSTKYPPLSTANCCTFVFIYQSITIFSFTQLRELEQCSVKTCSRFDPAAQVSKPGSLRRVFLWTALTTAQVRSDNRAGVYIDVGCFDGYTISK